MPFLPEDKSAPRSPDTPAPEVSVVVPAYNVAQYIAEALDSVFRQTFTNHEVIVVNDGSPDTEELERVLAPYRDRTVYLTQENKGLSGARNTAIRAARGRYVALLDADDFWEPDYLEVQLHFLQQHPEIDVVSCNCRFFGDKTYGGQEFMSVFPSHGPVTFESLVTRKCNLFVSVTAKRDAIEQVGLFDESLRSCEDYDLWLRLAAAGKRLGYHRKVLVHYRRRETSLSADPVWMAENNLKVLDKLQKTFPPTSAEWKLLEGQRQRKMAEADLARGKQAFARGDTAAALEFFRKANQVFRSYQLSGTIFALRLMPKLILRAHRFKRRLQASV